MIIIIIKYIYRVNKYVFIILINLYGNKLNYNIKYSFNQLWPYEIYISKWNFIVIKFLSYFHFIYSILITFMFRLGIIKRIYHISVFKSSSSKSENKIMQMNLFAIWHQQNIVIRLKHKSFITTNNCTSLSLKGYLEIILYNLQLYVMESPSLPIDA